tara:strand:- start:2316 stop:3527 length:1212 start_codon:yes stop_codon:yes gene_type:complete
MLARPIFFIIILLDISVLWSRPSVSEIIGVAEKIVGNVHTSKPSEKISSGDQLFYNQYIKTKINSGATIKFGDGTFLNIGPDSELQLDDLVYNKKSKVLTGYLNLTGGIFQFSNDLKSQMYVTLKTPVATIGIRGTKFSAFAKRSYSELAVTEGNIDTFSKFGTFNIGKNQALQITTNTLRKSRSISEEMKYLFDKASALLNFESELEMFEIAESLDAQSWQKSCEGQPSNWLYDKKLLGILEGKDIRKLLFVKTSYGIIVIRPNSGTQTGLVSKISRLVKENFFTNMPFFNVRLGIIAEAGDYFGKKTNLEGGKIRKVSLRPITFKRGSVASGYPNDKKLGGGRSFAISLRFMKLKKSDYRIWGKVIYGIQFADKLEIGSPPDSPDFILDMKTGSQIQEDCL